MNRTIFVAGLSVLLAALLSTIYLFYTKDDKEWRASSYGAWLLLYVLCQITAGAFFDNKPVGRGLMLGARLILVIGFSVCTSGLI